MLVVRLLIDSRLLVKFRGIRIYIQVFHHMGFGAPNPHVAPGSTVLLEKARWSVAAGKGCGVRYHANDGQQEGREQERRKAESPQETGEQPGPCVCQLAFYSG